MAQSAFSVLLAIPEILYVLMYVAVCEKINLLLHLLSEGYFRLEY